MRKGNDPVTRVRRDYTMIISDLTVSNVMNSGCLKSQFLPQFCRTGVIMQNSRATANHKQYIGTRESRQEANREIFH